jgi:hypothetical protein
VDEYPLEIGLGGVNDGARSRYQELEMDTIVSSLVFFLLGSLALYGEGCVL